MASKLQNLCVDYEFKATKQDAVMNAVLFEKFNEAPKMVTVDDPRPEPHGVVIEVKATGV